jgi:hypothetical protein
MPSLFALQSLRNELSHVDEMLEQLTDPFDTIRVMWEQRRKELQNQIAAIENDVVTLATVALVFEGGPVIGAQEIRVDFAAKALESYQGLVSSVYADQVGHTLGSKGPLPRASESRLYLAELVHGSMGFLLNEVPERQGSLLQSRLSLAVDKASELLRGLASESLGEFEETLQQVKPRVLRGIKSLTRTLRDYAAEARIIAGRDELSLDLLSISKLIDRLDDVLVTDDDETLDGVLTGLFPYEGTFEFSPDSGHGVLHGPASEMMIDRYIASASDIVERHGRAKFKLIRTTRAGVVLKEQRILWSFDVDADSQLGFPSGE